MRLRLSSPTKAEENTRCSSCCGVVLVVAVFGLVLMAMSLTMLTTMLSGFALSLLMVVVMVLVVGSEDAVDDVSAAISRCVVPERPMPSTCVDDQEEASTIVSRAALRIPSHAMPCHALPAGLCSGVGRLS